MKTKLARLLALLALAACGGGRGGGGGNGGGGGFDVLTPDNFGKRVGQGSVKILDNKFVMLGTSKGDREFDLGARFRAYPNYYVSEKRIGENSKEKLVLGGRKGGYEYIDFGYWANIDTRVEGVKVMSDGTINSFAYGNASRYVDTPTNLALAMFRGTALGGVEIRGGSGTSNFKELVGSATIRFNETGDFAGAVIDFPNMYILTMDGTSIAVTDQTSKTNAAFSLDQAKDWKPGDNTFDYGFFGPTANTATEMVGTFLYNATHTDSREIKISGSFGAKKR